MAVLLCHKITLSGKLSNDTLTVLDGTLYSKTNSYLLVEGKSDVNCIKAAINRFLNSISCKIYQLYLLMGHQKQKFF